MPAERGGTAAAGTDIRETEYLLSSATSKSTLTRKQPPDLLGSEAESASSVRGDSDQQSTLDDQTTPSRLRSILLSLTATSWYLSFLLHLLSFATATAVFWLIGAGLIADPEPELQPVRASLADKEVYDDSPLIEMAPNIGLGTEDTDSSVEQLASNLRIVDSGLVETLDNAGLTSLAGEKDNDGGGQDGSGFLFKIPESGLAVTKGSFTAWTEPENPEPGSAYLIIIEVRLPDDTKRYRVADLRGEVIGTDGYSQKIPYDSRHRTAAAVTTETRQIPLTGNDIVDVRNNKVQFAIRVPGAAKLVQDTIKVKSRRLREEQELVLTFGSARRSNRD
jgi:hypothetical protein